MTVTGVEEGKEVTETYEAKDADELKRDNPEAFDLYERWNGSGPLHASTRAGDRHSGSGRPAARRPERQAGAAG